MKKRFLMAMAVVMSITAMAQTEFREISFEEALKAAKCEGKIVMIDCYTSWCGPCKAMAAKEFPKKEMGDYINPKFVPLKMDMEKGEGVAVGKRYGVSAFPTFLFIDSNGELLHRMVGYKSVESFIKEAEEGLSGPGIVSMMKRYEAGERSEMFVQEYITALMRNMMSDEINEVLVELLKDADANTLVENEKYFDLFRYYINEKDNPVFQKMYAGKDILIAKYGKQAEHKFLQVIKRHPYQFATFEGKTLAAFDYVKLDAYVDELKTQGVKQADQIGAFFRAYTAATLGTPEELLKWVKAYAAEGVTDSWEYASLLSALYDKGMTAETKSLAEVYIAELNKQLAVDTNEMNRKSIEREIKRFQEYLTTLDENKD